MTIDWWTLGLQLINALVLVWILGKFLFRPVSDMIRARQDEADLALADAAKARDAAAAALREATDSTARIAAERGDMLKAAARDADAEKQTILDAARDAADEIRAAAARDIETLRRNETAAAAAYADRLAVDIAGRLFARLPDEARISGFIEGLATAISALPENTRKDMLGPDNRLVIRTARDMTDGERSACAAMLEGALGARVDFSTETDPDLIAGLELGSAHVEIRNSFRADLERIAAELASHDRSGQ